MQAAQLRVEKRRFQPVKRWGLMTMSERIAIPTWRGSAVALGIWAFWVVLPSALLKATPPQAFAVAQLGAASVSYLDDAPGALCWYVILGQCVMLPALIALAWGRRGPPERLVVGHPTTRERLVGLLAFLGSWAVLYLFGNWLMAAIDWQRGAEASVVRGYASYLGLFGFLATLPQWGWVFACRMLIRRSWLSALASLLIGGVSSVLSLVLQTRQFAWPTPVFLRNQLFSGRGDVVAHAEWGFVLWGALPAMIALALLAWRSHWRPATARLGVDA
jgi:hypothetical protein